MELLVVRHAVAKDKEAFARKGRSDAERPLTKEGRREFRRGARGIARLAGEVDLLATSPFARALETAELLAPALGLGRALRRPELEQGAPARALVAWLARQRRDGTVAIVGHEPDLSGLVAIFLTGRTRDLVELEKGGACLLAFEGRVGPGAGRLRWLLGAKALRRLAR
jgi:phosphohistidine phosphatase